MYSWRRIVIGDAFKLHINYYRDLALCVPFLVFSVAAAIRGFSDLRTPGDTLLFHRQLVAVILCLLLAKEKIILLGFVFLVFVGRGLPAALLHHEWRVALWLTLVAAAGIGVAIALGRADWSPSYEIPKRHCVVGYLIVVTSAILTCFLATRMQTWPPTTLFAKAFTI